MHVLRVSRGIEKETEFREIRDLGLGMESVRNPNARFTGEEGW